MRLSAATAEEIWSKQQCRASAKKARRWLVQARLTRDISLLLCLGLPGCCRACPIVSRRTPRGNNWKTQSSVFFLSLAKVSIPAADPVKILRLREIGAFRTFLL